MQKLNEKQINLIKQTILIEQNKYIVRLNVSGEKTISKFECNNNIYCVNGQHEVIWQIQAQETGFEEEPFVGIYYEGQNLVARNFSGFKYQARRLG